MSAFDDCSDVAIIARKGQTFIEAMNRAYDMDLTPLSDQEILATAGIADPNPGGNPTYFDIRSFVFAPEPTSIALLCVGLVSLALGRRGFC